MPPILKLLAGEDQPLLVLGGGGGVALSFMSEDSTEGDGLTGECLHQDLHPRA